jgi:hypothetical protein
MGLYVDADAEGDELAGGFEDVDVLEAIGVEVESGDEATDSCADDGDASV